MADEPKDLRIPIYMSSREVEAIDEWRFANKIATRAEAVRRLCQMGIGFDTESERIKKQADYLGEMSRSIISMYIGALEQKISIYTIRFGDELVKLLGEAFKNKGMIHRLVGAASLSKTSEDEGIVSTYKEALQKFWEDHKKSKISEE